MMEHSPTGATTVYRLFNIKVLPVYCCACWYRPYVLAQPHKYRSPSLGPRFRDNYRACTTDSAAPTPIQQATAGDRGGSVESKKYFNGLGLRFRGTQLMGLPSSICSGAAWGKQDEAGARYIIRCVSDR